MNVKPGDLAIVIGSKAGNQGKIVEVIGPLGVEPIYGGLKWGRGTGNFFWLVKGNTALYDTGGNIRSIIPCRDIWLRPVSGLPDAEHTDESEPIKELA
jgi:hypothetical protein